MGFLQKSLCPVVICPYLALKQEEEEIQEEMQQEEEEEARVSNSVTHAKDVRVSLFLNIKIIIKQTQGGSRVELVFWDVNVEIRIRNSSQVRL